MPVADDVQKKKHDVADLKIARFFFHNSIPFNASVAECEPAGCVAPTYDELISTLLEKVGGEIRENYNRMLRDEWRETDCTIL